MFGKIQHFIHSIKIEINTVFSISNVWVTSLLSMSIYNCTISEIQHFVCNAAINIANVKYTYSQWKIIIQNVVFTDLVAITLCNFVTFFCMKNSSERGKRKKQQRGKKQEKPVGQTQERQDAVALAAHLMGGASADVRGDTGGGDSEKKLKNLKKVLKVHSRPLCQ